MHTNDPTEVQCVEDTVVVDDFKVVGRADLPTHTAWYLTGNTKGQHVATQVRRSSGFRKNKTKRIQRRLFVM